MTDENSEREGDETDEQTQYGGNQDIDAVEQTESDPVSPDSTQNDEEEGEEEGEAEDRADEEEEDDGERVDEEEWTETEHENPDDRED